MRHESLAGGNLAPAFFLIAQPRRRRPTQTSGSARAAADPMAGGQSVFEGQRWNSDGCCISISGSRRTDGLLRELPSSEVCVHRRAARLHGHQGAEGRPQRSHGFQSRLQPGAVLGRPRRDARRAGQGPDGESDRDGEYARGARRQAQEIPGYRPLFAEAFGSDEINIDHVAKAIATFERTVLSGNSPYDQYKAGKKKAMTRAAGARHATSSSDKAKCDACHEGINFTTNAYHNLGIGTDKPKPDEGRYRGHQEPKRTGAPSKRRRCAKSRRTAPYMHDGSLKTLEEVVDFYDKGGIPNKNLDEKIKPSN